MKHLATILLLAFCATASSQTIKSLGYNTSNGQIVSATNVVWTNAFNFSTNNVAAQVRANLGISNTFAGQFHADFYDDFSRYTNGTVVGDGFVPMKGGAYTMRWGSTNYSSPLIVSNGSVASTNGEIWYLTSQLDRPVYNFGAVVEFDQATSLNNATILIQPDTAWIGRVLHISVTPWSIGVDVSTNGVAGFGGTNTIIFTNYANTTPILTNSKQTIIGHIEGDTLHLRVGGHVYSASHPFIPLVVGPYFTFESFYLTNTVTNRWHKVWANSPTMADIYSQPLSQELQSLARGYGDFTTRLIVSTNPLSRISDLSTNSKAWFDGNILVNGLVRSKSGTNQFFNIGAISVQQKQAANANTNTTNLMTLRTLNILGGLLATEGSRWKGTFVGSLANNTNEKRIVLDMAGNHIDLSTTNSGEWILESIVYGTSTNSHEGFAILRGEGFTETARWTFNNGSGVQFDVNLRASSTSNNEVTLRGAWADWYP